MQSNAKAKDAEVNERSIEDLLSALVNIRDVPLVGELVIAQRTAEYVLCYDIVTMMKQVKKEYNVTANRATFLLLVCIIFNHLVSYTYITITTSLQESPLSHQPE